MLVKGKGRRQATRDVDFSMECHSCSGKLFVSVGLVEGCLTFLADALKALIRRLQVACSITRQPLLGLPGAFRTNGPFIPYPRGIRPL